MATQDATRHTGREEDNMIKRDKIDVECVRAFVAAHAAETKV